MWPNTSRSVVFVEVRDEIIKERREIWVAEKLRAAVLTCAGGFCSMWRADCGEAKGEEREGLGFREREGKREFREEDEEGEAKAIAVGRIEAVAALLKDRRKAISGSVCSTLTQQKDREGSSSWLGGWWKIENKGGTLHVGLVQLISIKMSRAGA